MADGVLSQEEINALLNGNSGADNSEQTVDNTDLEFQEIPNVLSDLEKDVLGEVGNICMGNAATTLSILLNNKVDITTPRVTVANIQQIKSAYPMPYLVIEVAYTHGLNGTNILAIKEHEAMIIADLMMGGDGLNPPTETTELYMSAVSEAMNQMMGAISTSMSTMLAKKIDISPPKCEIVDFSHTGEITKSVGMQDPVAKISFSLKIGDLINSEIMQIVTIDVAKAMVADMMNPTEATPEPKKETAPVIPPQTPPTNMQQPMMDQQQMMQQPMMQQQMMYQQPMYQQPMMQQPMMYQQPMMQQQAAVQPVQFTPLQPQFMGALDGNMNLLMDVSLQVTVELGRTKKLIKDVLELSPGSIIELDKLAGEPVDVYINTKLIAKGEVVVIDENFGVRITEIVNKTDRLNTLQ